MAKLVVKKDALEVKAQKLQKKLDSEGLNAKEFQTLLRIKNKQNSKA